MIAHIESWLVCSFKNLLQENLQDLAKIDRILQRSCNNWKNRRELTRIGKNQQELCKNWQELVRTGKNQKELQGWP